MNKSEVRDIICHAHFHLGIPVGYPLPKIGKIKSFGSSLEALGINFEVKRGNHYRDDSGTSLGKANIDADIMTRLLANVVAPYLVNRARPSRRLLREDKVLRVVNEQYEKYLSKPPISVVIFTGDEDFLPLAKQIESYSQTPLITSLNTSDTFLSNPEDTNLSESLYSKNLDIRTLDIRTLDSKSEDEAIKVYFASHPCIANGRIKEKSSFINLEEVLTNEEYQPPWKSGTVIAEVDGNNYLNSLPNGGVGGITDREDWPSVLSITKQIFTRLHLLNNLPHITYQ